MQIIALFLSIFTWAQQPDPCLRFDSVPKPATQQLQTVDLESVLGLEITERVEILCQLKAALLEQYAGFAIKKDRMPLDLKAHLNSCVADEMNTTDSSRLRFMERTQRCLSAFDDGHLKAGRVLDTAAVVLPIRTALVEGKVYVAAVEPKFIEYYGRKKVNEAQQKLLTVGAEVLEIDEKPVEEVLASISQHVGASSELGKKSLAAQIITRRNFLYSDSDFARVKIKTVSGDTIVYNLPWMMIPNSGAPESIALLRRLGIPTLNSSDGTTNNAGGNNFVFLDYLIWPEFYFAEKTHQLFDSNNRLQARMGEVVLSRKAVFCYLDLRTAVDEYVHLSNGQAGSLLTWIRTFMKTCEEKALPLVLDLRHNFGGTLDFPEKFISTLVFENKAYPQSFVSIRTAKGNLSTVLSLLNNPEVPLPPTIADKSFEAAKKGEPFSAPNVGKQIQVDPEVGGFSQPIVTIIGPYCTSGCEIIAGLLKKSNRSMLVGESTMGTGLGHLRSNPPIHVFFDRFNILSVSIPIFAFGILPADVDANQLTYKDALSYSMENQPVEPDIKHEYTVEDLTTGGWPLINKINRLIETMSNTSLNDGAYHPCNMAYGFEKYVGEGNCH